MEWYCYADNMLKHSCQTKEEAIAWCKGQLALWQEAGAPRHPTYKVHYNGLVKNDPIIVEEGASPCYLTTSTTSQKQTKQPQARR